MACGPLFSPGYFWSAHDARHSVYFLFIWDRGVQDGLLYTRWSPDFAFGFGYPIFNIYPPLAYILGEIAHLVLRLNLVDSVKLVFGLGMVASGWAMYAYVRRLAGQTGAILAAAVYMYMPYHLENIYVRGALAESLALVFCPLILLGLYDLVTQPSYKALVIAALSYGGLLLTHNGAMVIFTPAIALYAIFLALVAGRKRLLPNLLRMGAGGLLGILLSMIFLLPLALEQRALNTEDWFENYYDFRNHWVYFHQLFAPDWGYGISMPGPHDTMSFQLGAVPVMLAAFALIPLLAKWGTSWLRAHIAFFWVLAAGAVFMMLEVSAPVWNVIGLATTIQFPWRLLAIPLVALAALSGIAILHAGRAQWVALVALLAIVLFGSYTYLSPPLVVDPPEGPVGFAGIERFEEDSGELVGLTQAVDLAHKPTAAISPLVDEYKRNQAPATTLARGLLPDGAMATVLRRTTVDDEVRLTLPAATTVTFYSRFYPGWNAYIDGQRVNITVEKPNGWITVPVPAGEHTVAIRFEQTLPRIAGTALTILTALGMLLWPFVRRVRR